MPENEKEYPLKLNPDYYVVTANDLIKGRQRMSLREAQLLFIAISQVVKEDKDFKTCTTTVSELSSFMGDSPENLYRDLKGICKSLCQQVVEVQIGGENSKGKAKWKVFSWVQSAEYDSGKLTLRLSDDIKPYLLDLDRYYTQTQLGTLMTFRSYYTTRLYQYLRADTGAKREYQEEWYFTCDELRDLFQVKDNQYSRTYNLIQKTIVPALDELGKSDFAYIWDYEEHRANRRGRPLIGVSFKAIFFDDKAKKDYYIKRAKPLIEHYTSQMVLDDIPEDFNPGKGV